MAADETFKSSENAKQVKPIVLGFFEEERFYSGGTFMVIRDEEGKITDGILNRIPEEFIREFALVKETLIGKHLSELIDETGLTALIEKSNETMVSGRIHCFKMHLPSHGRCFLASIYRIDQNNLGISITDITKSEQETEEIHNRLELLNHITNSSPSRIFVRDCEGKTILFNKSMAECHPVLKEKGNNTYVEEIWSPETAEVILANEQKILREGVPARLEETLMINGELRTYTALKFPVRDGRGMICGVGSVITDISESKRIERALIDNEARTTAFLENSATIAWMKDRDGHYLYMSSNYKKQFDTDYDSWIGLTDYDFWPKEIAEKFGENDRKVLESWTPIEVIEETRTLDGKEKWWLNFKFPFENSFGEKFIGGLGVDISERVLAERALLEADRHKDEFLAILSHELRNPLASIRNGLYILDRVTPGGESAKRAKNIIDRQFGQLCHIVDDLLDITRINRNKIEIKREPVNVSALVQRVMDDYRSIYQENAISLLNEFQNEHIYVNGDRLRLAQVFGNLLHNAVKFTNRGGHVHVGVAIDSLTQTAAIEVADDGIGIIPELIPRLFEPFIQAETTLDRSGGGLGLGLPLVKGLVELHGGTVSALSLGTGQGSKFIVRLPLELNAVVPLSNPPNPVLPSRTCRVLVIEDNTDVANSLRDAIKLIGHNVMIAFNGPDGIKVARLFKPDVLFCDIGLPDMDGYAVAKAFREDEFLNKIYLVALTGYALPDDVNKAIAAGFDLHLAKPPKLQQLEEILALNSKNAPVE